MTGTVLVVEDEVVLLQAIVKKLELAGVVVATAITGREAVSYLQKAAEMPEIMKAPSSASMARRCIILFLSL